MAARRVNSASIDVTMAQRRAHETQTKILQNYVSDNRYLQSAALSENKLPQRRRMANTAKLENERRIKQLQEERYVAEYAQDFDRRQSEALASELERRKAEHDRKEREVLRICNESEELKDLERKLKFAYMNKERAAQHEERILAERRTLYRERAMEELMEAERRAAVAAEAEAASHSKDTMYAQKEALQRQMVEREALKEEALIEAERDRELVDAVVRKILQEDEAEVAARNRRKAETQAAIRDYEVQRNLEVRAARERALREDTEIQNHASAIARREGAIAQAKADKKTRDAAKFAQIVAETERVKAESYELDALRDLLWAEEMEAARRRDEEERAEKRMKQKQEMAAANEEMLRNKENKRRADAVEEDRLVELMRNKFAEDEAAERAAARRRKEQTAKYIGAVNAQKAERHAMYEAAKRAELDDHDTEAKIEDYRLRVVREARRRLLAEHAKHLKGYLPKGDWSDIDDFVHR